MIKAEKEEHVMLIKSVFGPDVSEQDVRRALSLSNNFITVAMDYLIDSRAASSPPLTVKRTATSTGGRISTQIKQENGEEIKGSEGFDKVIVKKEVENSDESDVGFVKEEVLDVKKPNLDGKNLNGLAQARENNPSQVLDLDVQPLSVRRISDDEYRRIKMSSGDSNNKQSLVAKKERVEDRMLSTVVIEDGDFPEETDWLLVGSHVIMGLSTTKGRKIENNEIVHFVFPHRNSSWNKSAIVRFSTKRNGEVN